MSSHFCQLRCGFPINISGLHIAWRNNEKATYVNRDRDIKFDINTMDINAANNTTTVDVDSNN